MEMGMDGMEWFADLCVRVVVTDDGDDGAEDD